MKLTKEELDHLHKRRLTQALWKDFKPVKCPMEWYKHNTPTCLLYTSDAADE